MIDVAGRVIDYMRISITDRCNLRCRYCMPDGITQVSMAEILTYEEIQKVCIMIWNLQTLILLKMKAEIKISLHPELIWEFLWMR